MNKYVKYITESFDDYMHNIQYEEKGMPILLLCLARKGFLRISKGNSTTDECELFSLQDECSSDNSLISVAYQIPPTDNQTEWISIIEYIVKRYQVKLESYIEDFSTFELVISDNVVSKNKELYKLYVLAQRLLKVIDFPKASYNLGEFFYNYDKYTFNPYPNLTLLQIGKDILGYHTDDIVYTPLAGSATFSFYFNDFKRFIGRTLYTRNYHLGKLFLLTQSKIKDYDWGFYIPKEKSSSVYDYVLINSDFETKPNDMIQDVLDIYVKIAADSLHHLSDRGRMVIDIPSPDYTQEYYEELVKELIDNSLIEKIISFENEHLLLLINKERDYDEPIQQIFINENTLTFNYKNWVKQKGVETFFTTTDELRNENYRLTFNPILKRLLIKIAEPNFKIFRLANCLSEVKRYFGDKPSGYYLSNKSLESIQKDNYPFNPYLSETDAVSKKCTSVDFEVIDEQSLVITRCKKDTHKLLPWLFRKTTKDCTLTNAYSFKLDSTKIDPQYLILQLNEPYFIQEMEACDLLTDECAYYDYKHDFLNLYIKVPDCITSIERQKQIVAAASWKHVLQTSKTLGVNLGDISIARDTDLRNDTYLYHEKYQIKKPLGRGGFGRTYVALNKKPVAGEPIQVAIKEFFVNNYQKRNPKNDNVVPLPNKDCDQLEKARRKFQAEALRIKELQECEYIIKVFDVFDENGTTYYSMEYMKNGDLKTYCEQMIANGQLNETDVKRIIFEVASALQVMHAHKMNHLDIKPSNILVDNNGHIRLIDFGTVRSFENAEDRVSTQLHVYSAEFTDPHLASYKGFSPLPDIYSLGATMRFLLERSSESTVGSVFLSPNELSSNSDTLTSLYEQCLSYDLAERPQSIDEFLDKLALC